MKTFMTVNGLLLFLQVVNFSHNRLTKMKDLSTFSSLTILDLDRILSDLPCVCDLTHSHTLSLSFSLLHS